MSDTHFSPSSISPEDTWWNRTTERFSERMGEALINLVRSLAPDFVIHCGDFVGVCSPESIELGTDVMDSLGCPWYAVPGNHDTWCREPRAHMKARFYPDRNSCSYIRDIGGLRFFFLDTAYWYGYDGSVTAVLDREQYNAGAVRSIGPLEDDLRWLEIELERTTVPSVFISHAPVAYRKSYPAATLPHGMPVEGPLTPPERFITDMIGREKLHRIARDYTTIKACFAGHWHINDVLNDDGVWYIMTAALREYPYEIRLVEFSDNGLVISTHQLNVPELRRLSYVKEWGNRWIEGEQGVRFVRCTFR